MFEALWANGHIGWPLFTVLVFSMLLLLGMDTIWRTVRIRAIFLGVIGAVFWFGGLGAIVWLTID